MYFGKQSVVCVTKDQTLVSPLKILRATFSAMRMKSYKMQRIFWRSFDSNKGHQWWHTRTDMFQGRESLHSKRGRSDDRPDKIRKSVSWKWNLTRDVESIKQERNSLANSSLSSWWKFGKTPKEWQTGVIIPIFNKFDRKQCTNYKGISHLSFPEKMYAKFLERKRPWNSGIQNVGWTMRYRPGRSTTDQIFTLKQIFEISWEYGKDLFAYFVDLEKTYDRVPRDKIWRFFARVWHWRSAVDCHQAFLLPTRSCVRDIGK